MGNQLVAPPMVNLSDISTSLQLVAPLGGGERRGLFRSMHCTTPVGSSLYATWAEGGSPGPGVNPLVSSGSASSGTPPALGSGGIAALPVAGGPNIVIGGSAVASLNTGNPGSLLTVWGSDSFNPLAAPSHAFAPRPSRWTNMMAGGGSYPGGSIVGGGAAGHPPSVSVGSGGYPKGATVDVVVKVFVRQAEDKMQQQLVGRYFESLRAVERRWKEKFGGNLSTKPCNLLPYAELDVKHDRYCKLQRPYLPYSLKERLVSRPFLSKEQRLFACYQLLRAAEQLHDVLGTVHGDIKADNVLFSSSGWLYLTDLSPFKPAILPSYNPADFDYYYDNDETRNCCAAPEKFYNQNAFIHEVIGGFSSCEEKAAGPASNEALLPSVEARASDGSAGGLGDRVSVAALAADQARVGSPHAAGLTHTWSMDMFSVVCVMVHILTEEPLFKLSSVLEMRSMTPAQRRDYVGDIFQERRLDDSGLRAMLMSVLCVAPGDRPTAAQLLRRYTPSVFPRPFELLHQTVFPAILALTPDAQIQLLWSQLGDILEMCNARSAVAVAADGANASGEGKLPVEGHVGEPLSYVPEMRHGRFVAVSLTLPLVLAVSRHVVMDDSRCRIVSILDQCFQWTSLDMRRDVLLPYLVYFLRRKSSGTAARVLSLRTITAICATLRTFPASEATLFDDFVIPCAEVISQASTSPLLLEEMARQLPTLLLLSQEYLRQRQVLVSASAWRSGYDAQLNTIISQGWELLRPLYMHSNTSVSIAMLKQTSDVARFLGEERVQDELIPLLTTTAASAIEVQRELYSQAIRCHLCFRGPRMKTIQFFVDEGLRQTDSMCLANTIDSIAAIVSAMSLPVWCSMTLVHQALPQIMNPNMWVSRAARRLVEVSARTYRSSDVLSFLECAIRPLLTHGVPLAYMNHFPSVVKSELALFPPEVEEQRCDDEDSVRLVGGDSGVHGVSGAPAFTVPHTAVCMPTISSVASGVSLILGKADVQITVPAVVPKRNVGDVAMADVRLVDITTEASVLERFMPLLQKRYSKLSADSAVAGVQGCDHAPCIDALGPDAHKAVPLGPLQAAMSSSAPQWQLTFRASSRQAERVLYSLHMSQNHEQRTPQRDAPMSGSLESAALAASTKVTAGQQIKGAVTRLGKVVNHETSRGLDGGSGCPNFSVASATGVLVSASSEEPSPLTLSATVMVRRPGSPATVTRQFLQQRAQQGLLRDGNGTTQSGSELNPSGACMVTAVHHNHSIYCTTFSRGALITAGGGGEMRLWCMEADGNDEIFLSGRSSAAPLKSHPLKSTPAGSSAGAIMFARFMSMEHSGMVCYGGDDGACRVIDVERDAILLERNPNHGPLAASCTQSANVMLVASASGHLFALDSRTSRSVWSTNLSPRHGVVSGLSPLLLNAQAYGMVATTLSGMVTLFDLRFQMDVAEYRLGGGDEGDDDGVLPTLPRASFMPRYRNHAILSVCPDPMPPTSSLASSTSGPSVILGTAQGAIYRFELATGRTAATFLPSTAVMGDSGSGLPVRALLAQSRRNIVFSAGEDCWIRSWNLHTPRASRTLCCHPYLSPTYAEENGTVYEQPGAVRHLVSTCTSSAPVFPTSSSRPHSQLSQRKSARKQGASHAAANMCGSDDLGKFDREVNVVAVPQLPPHHDDAILTLNIVEISSGPFLVSGARDGALKVWLNAT